MFNGTRPHLSRHALIMVLCCLIPIGILGAVAIFRIPLPQVLTYGLFLLCPLGHVLMMAMMAGGHDHASAPKADGKALAANGGGASEQRGAACH